VAPPADTSPGTLAEKLSRRASHHGAIFASPAKDKIVMVEGFVQSRSHVFGKKVKSYLSR
jgi:2-C-methyl-D-erythritol 4-phosphate cytidylyltransferase